MLASLRRTYPPHTIARKRLAVHAALVVAVLTAGAAGSVLLMRRTAAMRWQTAESLLRSTVDRFSQCRLNIIGPPWEKRVKAADVLDERGRVVATVLLRSPQRLYVTFAMPGWRYKPATDAVTRRILDDAPPGDPAVLRAVKHALGGLKLLWPQLPLRSVHFDGVQAVSRTAREATVELSVDPGSGRIGCAVELDLYNYRLLAVELRYDVSG